MTECYSRHFLLNGNILPCSSFRKSAFEEGPSMYEVLRAMKGFPVFLEEHIQRLTRSCLAEKLNLSVDPDQIRKSVYELIRVNGNRDGNIKFILTWVKKELKYFSVYYIEHHYPTAEEYLQGVKTTLYFRSRANPNIKYVNFDFKEEAFAHIDARGAVEALLIDRDGFVTEGSRSNVFFVRDDGLLSPPSHKMLKGVTRDKVIDIAGRLKIAFRECEISHDQIDDHDACFLTGTSFKVLPIHQVDDHWFSVENAMMRQIMHAYDEQIGSLIAGAPIGSHTRDTLTPGHD
jgi:branched-chain amino acid aminotransferase